MKLLSKFNVLIIASFMVIGFFSGEASAEKVILKYAEIASKGQPQIDFAEQFAKAVAEKSKGSMEVKIYPSGILAGYTLDSVQSGIADINEMALGMGKDLLPWITVLEAPYLVRSKEVFHKLADPTGEFLTAANDQLREHNLLILGMFNFGTRDLTFKKAVYSPDDIAGAKLRVVPSPTWIATWEAIGVTPIPMPSSEMVTAMLTGAIDGQENSWHDIAGKSLWDVQSHIMRTQHLMTPAPLWMNLKKWQSLTSEQKNILISAMKESTIWFDEVYTVKKMDEYQRLFSEKGMKIIGPSDGLKVEEFAKKSKDVFKKFEKEWGDWPRKIREMHN